MSALRAARVGDSRRNKGFRCRTRLESNGSSVVFRWRANGDASDDSDDVLPASSMQEISLLNEARFVAESALSTAENSYHILTTLIFPPRILRAKSDFYRHVSR